MCKLSVMHIYVSLHTQHMHIEQGRVHTLVSCGPTGKRGGKGTEVRGTKGADIIIIIIIIILDSTDFQPS